MAYLWVKALHIAAVLCWIGGLLTAAVTIAGVSAKSDPASPWRSAMSEMVGRWDRRVTVPAMLVTWGAGLALAMQGQWFGASWLTIKLAFVLALSALHGVLSGTLRRLAHSDAPPLPSWLAHAPLLIISGVAAIVVLVIVKPF